MSNPVITYLQRRLRDDGGMPPEAYFLRHGPDDDLAAFTYGEAREHVDKWEEIQEREALDELTDYENRVRVGDTEIQATANLLHSLCRLAGVEQPGDLQGRIRELQRAADLKEPTDVVLFRNISNQLDEAREQLAAERAARAAAEKRADGLHDQCAHWEKIAQRLASDALVALSRTVATPEKGYLAEPHCLRGDIGKLTTMLRRAQDALQSQPQQATAAPASMDEWPSFSERNRARCESPQGFNHALSSWSLSDWMTATAGEVGEAANIIKKLNRYRDGIPGNDRPESELRAMLANELADVAIYLDLMAQAAGFDLEEIRERKFQTTSKKIGYVEPNWKDEPDRCEPGKWPTYVELEADLAKLRAQLARIRGALAGIRNFHDWLETLGWLPHKQQHWWIKDGLSAVGAAAVAIEVAAIVGESGGGEKESEVANG